MYEITGTILSYYHNAPFITIAVAIVAIFFIFRYPKLFLKLALLALILWAIFYLINSLSSSGVSQKEKLLEKSRLSEPEK